MLSSEAGVIFGSHAMGDGSIMRHLALLNTLWDGKELQIGRRTSESYTMRGARLTLGLMVQEATLKAFFNKSGPLSRGIGFFARFLVTWPESTQGYRFYTEPPSTWPALDRFNRRIGEILNRPPAMDSHGGLTPIRLQLTPEAKTAWVTYHDEIEKELRSGAELYDVRDVASKSADNAVRLAALFEVFEHEVGSIQLASFDGACRIAAWHLNESRRFFGQFAVPPELMNAANLESWLLNYCKREGVSRVPVSEVQKSGPRHLRSKRMIESAVLELHQLGRARLVIDAHSRTIEVNAALLEPAVAVLAVGPRGAAANNDGGCQGAAL